MKSTIGEEETTTIEVVIGIIGTTIGITVGPEIGTVTEMVPGIANRSNYRREDGSQRCGNRNQDCAADPGIEIEIGVIGVAPEKALQSRSSSQNRYKK